MKVLWKVIFNTEEIQTILVSINGYFKSESAGSLIKSLHAV